MNLPDGEGGLLLPSDRVIERECKDDFHTYSFREHYATPCGACGRYSNTGRGTVQRRLRGTIPVVVDYQNGYIHPDGDIILKHRFEDELRDLITAAWIAGTLPDEIAKNLVEEDV